MGAKKEYEEAKLEGEELEKDSEEGAYTGMDGAESVSFLQVSSESGEGEEVEAQERIEQHMDDEAVKQDLAQEEAFKNIFEQRENKKKHDEEEKKNEAKKEYEEAKLEGEE